MSKQTQRFVTRYTEAVTQARKDKYSNRDTPPTNISSIITHSYPKPSPTNTTTKRMATTLTPKYPKKGRLIRSRSIAQSKHGSEKHTPTASPCRPRRVSPPASTKNSVASIHPALVYVTKPTHRKNSLSSPPIAYLDIAPHLGCTKTPTAFQAKINGSLNNSGYGILGPNTETPKYNIYLQNEAGELEIQLSYKIQELKLEGNNKKGQQGKLEIFQDFFEKVIEKDTTYSGILQRIKEGYEEWIMCNTVNTTIDILDDYIAEISEIKHKLKKEIQDKLSYKLRYDSLISENQDLRVKLSESEKKLSRLEDQISRLKSINIDNLPRDEFTWQYVLSENQNFSDTFSKLENRLKQEFLREKKLVDLICAIKARGYPVEQVYQEELQKKKKSRQSFSSLDQTSEDEHLDTETEPEPIVSGPPKFLQRPIQVPLLNLKRLHHDASSEEEEPPKANKYISESTKSFKITVDTHIEDDPNYKKLSSSGSIPKLNIPLESDSNFHTEFMSKMNEFSSSWRSLIEKDSR